MRASVERDVTSWFEDSLELTHHLVDVLELVKHTDITHVREDLGNRQKFFKVDQRKQDLSLFFCSPLYILTTGTYLVEKDHVKDVVLKGEFFKKGGSNNSHVTAL